MLVSQKFEEEYKKSWYKLKQTFCIEVKNNPFFLERNFISGIIKNYLFL